jgi:electron transport complex protein RnfA
MDMGTLVKIFITALLINNIVLMRFIALCSYIGMTSDVGQSVGMGLAVTFVTVLAAAVTWPIYTYLLVPQHLEFLKILVFILVIGALCQLVEYYLKKAVPGLYRAMGIYLPLITTNCAILAVTFDMVTFQYDFLQSIVFAVAVSLGYLIAMLLLAGLRERMRTSPIPSFMVDTPILFLATSLAAVAFMGFAGLVK